MSAAETMGVSAEQKKGWYQNRVIKTSIVKKDLKLFSQLLGKCGKGLKDRV